MIIFIYIIVQTIFEIINLLFADLLDIQTKLIILYYIISIGVMLVIYTTIHYPRLRNNYVSNYQYITLDDNSSNNNNKSISIRNLSPIERSGHSNSHNLNKIKHWSNIIDTEIGFEEFMNYLSMEFSSENLMFVTEV